MVVTASKPSKPAHSRKQREATEASALSVSRSFRAPARDAGVRVPTSPVGMCAVGAVLIELMFVRFVGLRKTALADRSSANGESRNRKRRYPSL